VQQKFRAACVISEKCRSYDHVMGMSQQTKDFAYEIVAFGA